MPTYSTVAEVKAANLKAGRYFFSPATLRTFKTRVLADVHAGHFFLTSEPDITGADRRYTIRVVDNDGEISNVGEFRQYATANAARKDMRRLQWLVLHTQHADVPLDRLLQGVQLDYEHAPYLVSLASEAYNAGRTWAREFNDWEDEKARNKAGHAWYDRVHGDRSDAAIDHVYGLVSMFDLGAQRPYSG